MTRSFVRFFFKDCQGNSEGDRCERCRPGYVLDARINQCVSQDQYQPSTGSGIYVDQRPYDSRGVTPLTIVLDPNQVEQRVPVQVLVCFRRKKYQCFFFCINKF